MTYVFDGKAFAKEKEILLEKKVSEIISLGGSAPQLSSIIIGDDPASILYVNLKKKAAERIGCELEVINLGSEISKEEVKKTINQHNIDQKVCGIMVQLPLPRSFSISDRDEILNSISSEKDIDGLREDSKFIAPTAKAVLEVLNFAISRSTIPNSPYSICVVGASGFEGKRIVEAIKGSSELRSKGDFKILEVNSKTLDLLPITRNSDVIISVVGSPELINANMVKGAVILIDVGSPKGDIAKEAYEKASFVSPVPGGVGPITITCLLENLISSI